MKQNKSMATLIVGACLALAALADDSTNTTTSPQANLKVATDKDGKVRQFTDEDEKALNSKKAETATLLSKRLNAPKVTVVRQLKGGTTMAEIGLDQVDYLVVKTDDNGVPMMVHRSEMKTVTTTKAEEK